MAAALLAALLLLQSPAGTYRTGPVAAPNSAPAYRVGPTTPGPANSDASASGAQGYAVSPDALLLRPRLRATGVTIDAYDPRVEAFRFPEDRFYEATILGGAAAAQGRQGPLDGAWELGGENGAALFRFQLVQPAEGEPVDGAWRSLAPPQGAAGAASTTSGFVLAAPEPGRLILRFFEPADAAPVMVTLRPMTDGTWRGEMVRGGAARPVVMRRR